MIVVARSWLERAALSGGVLVLAGALLAIAGAVLALRSARGRSAGVALGAGGIATAAAGVVLRRWADASLASFDDDAALGALAEALDRGERILPALRVAVASLALLFVLAAGWSAWRRGRRGSVVGADIALASLPLWVAAIACLIPAQQIARAGAERRQEEARIAAAGERACARVRRDRPELLRGEPCHADGDAWQPWPELLQIVVGPPSRVRYYGAWALCAVAGERVSCDWENRLFHDVVGWAGDARTSWPDAAWLELASMHVHGGHVAKREYLPAPAQVHWAPPRVVRNGASLRIEVDIAVQLPHSLSYEKVTRVTASVRETGSVELTEKRYY